MKPERVLEIADKHADVFYEEDYTLGKRVDVAMKKAIQEALEEENRWFFPENSELPEHSTKDIIALMKNGSMCIGETRYGEFYCNEWQRLVKWERIIRWRYVPEAPGGVDENKN